MNIGEQIIDFLYTRQLQVDERWSVRTDRGFTRWADQNAQTIEIVREVTGPNGQTGYLIGVRTETVAGVDLAELSEDALMEINEGPMRAAAMDGPVWDAETRTLSLCSLVRVHEGIEPWTAVLLGSAAVLQIAEARVLGPALADAIGGQPAVSGHPENGIRTEPDEMAFAASVFVAEGEEPCKWPESDFAETVKDYMNQPPSLGASGGGQGFTVEFPYGDGSSLCQVMGGQPHPLYGNGLFVLQRFPLAVPSPADGVRLALTLNASDLRHDGIGFGFGSYVYDNEMMCFTGFVPNSVHQQVALPNLYFSCAERARAASVRLTGTDWTAESFNPERSAMGRMMKPDKPADGTD